MNQAGRYRQRIHIQEYTDTTDPITGRTSRTWDTVYLDSDTPLDAYPAEVLTGPGREAMVSGTKLAETSARINFRWFPGLTETMRILWDGELDSDGNYSGKVYDIVSIERDATGRREYRVRCKDGFTPGA